MWTSVLTSGPLARKCHLSAAQKGRQLGPLFTQAQCSSCRLRREKWATPLIVDVDKVIALIACNGYGSISNRATFPHYAVLSASWFRLFPYLVAIISWCPHHNIIPVSAGAFLLEHVEMWPWTRAQTYIDRTSTQFCSTPACGMSICVADSFAVP